MAVQDSIRLRQIQRGHNQFIKSVVPSLQDLGYIVGVLHKRGFTMKGLEEELQLEKDPIKQFSSIQQFFVLTRLNGLLSSLSQGQSQQDGSLARVFQVPRMQAKSVSCMILCPLSPIERKGIGSSGDTYITMSVLMIVLCMKCSNLLSQMMIQFLHWYLSYHPYWKDQT